MQSLPITSIVGSDTTIYVPAKNCTLVTVDFSNFNADDATLDVGQSDDRVSFVSSSVSGLTWPITLSKVTYTKTANGYTRSRLCFEPSGDKWHGKYVVFKLTKVSVTSGTFKYEIN